MLSEGQAVCCLYEGSMPLCSRLLALLCARLLALMFEIDGTRAARTSRIDARLYAAVA